MPPRRNETPSRRRAARRSPAHRELPVAEPLLSRGLERPFGLSRPRPPVEAEWATSFPGPSRVADSFARPSQAYAQSLSQSRSIDDTVRPQNNAALAHQRGVTPTQFSCPTTS